MRRPLRSLLALALVAGPTALVTTPAQAAECTAPAIVEAGVEPTRVVIGSTKTKEFEYYLALRTNGCAIDTVRATATSAAGVGEDWTMKALGTEEGVTFYGTVIAVSPKNLLNSDAGTWRTSVQVLWDGPTVDAAQSLKVLRAARLSVNATPEPVRKGKTITVRGDLTRANWEKGRYAGYPNRPVTLQFKTPGGTYRDVATIKSNGSGALKKTVKATKDGCFRFSYAASSTTAGATSGGDCVDVK